MAAQLATTLSGFTGNLFADQEEMVEDADSDRMASWEKTYLAPSGEASQTSCKGTLRCDCTDLPCCTHPESADKFFTPLPGVKMGLFACLQVHPGQKRVMPMWCSSSLQSSAALHLLELPCLLCISTGGYRQSSKMACTMDTSP